jgi:hypothetical protein
MQVCATLRVTSGHLLRVGLDQAPTSLLYSGQRRRNSGACQAFTAVPGASEQAPDPPIRQLRQLLLIGLGILDGGHLGRWPVLAPAHAPAVVVGVPLKPWTL